MESNRKGDVLNSGNSSQNKEDGTNKGDDVRQSSENDAIQVLQCTDSFFVADTVEDDDSMMIPPTPDMLIPSTQEFNVEEEKLTSVLSVDETCTEDLSKTGHGEDIIVLEEDDPASDVTQDILELDVTQQLLPKKSSIEKVRDDQDDDDDWQLKFTETQETQELLSISRMREAKEKQLSESTESKDTSIEEPSLKKQSSSKLEESEQVHSKPVDKNPDKLQENFPSIDAESEDEIEPSQSCLIDYQKSSTYSAFRDEVLQSSLGARCSSSTPESQKCAKNNMPSLNKNTDILLNSDSPKPSAKLISPSSKLEQEIKSSLQTIDIDSDNDIKELKPVTDSDIVEITPSGKVVDEPIITKVDCWVVGKKDESSKEVTSLDCLSSKSASTENLKEIKFVKSHVSAVSDVKKFTIVDLDNSKDITISDLGDPKDITVSDLGDPKDITVSDLDDPKDLETPDRKSPSKDTRLSDLGNSKGVTTADMGSLKDSTTQNYKDRTLRDLKGSKDRTFPDVGDPKKNPDNPKDEIVLNPVEQVKITEQKDSAKGVLSPDVKTTPIVKKSNQDKISPVIISSDNQCKSLNSELSFECASVTEVPRTTSTPCEGKDNLITTSPQLKIVLTEIMPSVTPNKESEQRNSTSDENGRVDFDSSKGLQVSETVEPAPQSLKSILHHTSRLSRNKQKVQFQGGKELNKPISLGSFKDIKSFKKIYNFATKLGKKRSDAIMNLKSKEEFKLTLTVREHNVYLEESVQCENTGTLATSPHSNSGSGSLTATSSTSATSSSLEKSFHCCEHTPLRSIYSGELADNDSSSKSGNSSGMQLDNTGHSVPSQDPQKTSTQKSEPNSFSTFFDPKKEGEDTNEPKIEPVLSPIASTSTAQRKTTTRGRKRTVVNTSSSSSSSTKNSRKRGRYVKDESETTEGPSEIEKPSAVIEEVRLLKTTRGGRRRTADKGSATVPALKIEVQEISPEQEVNDGSPVGNIIPGVRVMARWTDGYYYPGVVQDQAKEDRWSVCFDDGKVKAISHESLLKASFIQPGTSILVQNSDSYFEPGIVRGLYREGNKVGYEIELDKGITKRYPRKSVVLSADQAKLIMSSRPPTTPATMTINLDNIVDGKRKRKSLQSPDLPPTKKSPRITHRDAIKEDSHVDTSAVSAVEATEAEEPESSNSKKRPTRKRKAAVTADKKAKLLVQKKTLKLFKDYAFMLTNTERKPVPKTESESLSSFSEEEDNIKPFDKDELVSFIVSRGGTVLEKFDDVKKCSKPHIYLLANTYLRTMKYIQCLAAGILCIKHHWVQNCCLEGEIQSVKNYVLPAGMSIITSEIVEWHGKTEILKNKKISLVSAPGNSFADNWTPVLLAAKVDFVQKSLPTSKSASANVDLIITNSVCPQDIIQAAKKKKIPVVSIEWLIQSLISGKYLPYDAHPKFKHDYTE